MVGPNIGNNTKKTISNYNKNASSSKLHNNTIKLYNKTLKPAHKTQSFPHIHQECQRNTKTATHGALTLSDRLSRVFQAQLEIFSSAIQWQVDWLNWRLLGTSVWVAGFCVSLSPWWMWGSFPHWKLCAFQSIFLKFFNSLWPDNFLFMSYTVAQYCYDMMCFFLCVRHTHKIF